MSDDPPWFRTNRGLAVVFVYALLTLVGVVLSTEPGALGGLGPDLNVSAQTGPSAAIPPAIYLYGFLGAMAYAFTSIIAKFERGTTGVVRVGIRALAALPLAAGVFLLAGTLGISAANGRVLAGTAFLVGLYVNVTLKALGGLAERLLGATAAAGNQAEGADDHETE